MHGRPNAMKAYRVIHSLTERKGIKMFKAIKNCAVNFIRDEEGAQIIEYALIVAVVSIALLLALSATTPGLFTGWLTRVKDCLTGAACV